jgi:flagellar hook-associated protein 1
MSISRLFDIGRRSMATYQRAMDATAHNVANSSNPDYSRQRVVFGTERPEMVNGIVWGTGIKIEDIQRVRNSLTDSQIRINNQKLYENNFRSSVFSQVEVVITEPSEYGLSSLLTGFFNSWNELAVTPNSSALRNNVVRSAQNLSSKVNDIYSGLDILRADLLNQAKDKVQFLNSALDEIQQLNAQIFETSTIWLQANDLMDKRDQKLDELSKLVNVNISFDEKNSAIVTVGGIFAADQLNVTHFKLADINGRLELVTEDGNIRASNPGGELSAAMTAYSRDIPDFQSNINELITALMDSVNSIHTRGYSAGNPPLSGIKFFEGYSNGVLKINQDILLDNLNISVSADGTLGNGDIATQISELSNSKLINNQSLSTFYSVMVSSLGNEKLSADQLYESTNLVIQQLERQRTSYSGVSLDEEMTNIIKFQRSYDASAKMIKVADELLQTILTMV